MTLIWTTLIETVDSKSVILMNNVMIIIVTVAGYSEKIPFN